MISRRALSFALISLLPLSSQALPNTHLLWPATSDNVRPGPAALYNRHGSVIGVNAPFLTLYTPEHFNGKTVLIAAGGGYRRIEQNKEAIPTAHLLAQHGFRVYVLTYRLPNEHWAEGKNVAIDDVHQALKIIMPTNPHLSVLGYSAGAHLLALAINRTLIASPITENKPRLEGMALIYPIVTVEAPYNHSATHRVLVGPLTNLQEEKKWSVQHYINDYSPPLFVIESDDDPIAPPINGQLLLTAAKQHHVPITLIRYKTGGHGFGLGRVGTAESAWPKHYLSWLNQLSAHRAKGS
ncbi:alpha/beta hydrolase [Rosenbergiella australiborealis]|uniref:alpha/beta hydrolase n=1 Tax=Rosenbergiella australiborealis TaxID=1544696 RepID=UPI001F4DAB15|nr:alpha/beta hydrolase [Rosenbergiella australiborealis]